MENRLLVGYDLGKRYTQIGCFNRETLEPDTIGMGEGPEVSSDKVPLPGSFVPRTKAAPNDNFLIPTVLGVTKESHEWLFGREAVQKASEEEAVLVENLLDAAEHGNRIIIFGREFSPEVLLEKYFRKTLALLTAYYPNGRIEKLVVTIEELQVSLIEVIYKAMAAVGLHRDRLSVISRMQSYFHYALNQKKELWMNDVGLFDYGEDGLKYYQLSLNRTGTPMVAGVICKDFSNTMRYEMLSDPEDLDKLPILFSNIAQTVLHRQIVSTLYMTGRGFTGKWANDIFRSLCVGRRVFKGMNIYCAGACFAAREFAGEKKLLFLFLGDGILHHEVSIPALAYGKDIEITLAESAKPWYEQKAEVELITDGEEEIELCIRDILKKEEIVRGIPLTGMPKRPERMTRILVELHFLDEHHFVVTIHDEGFGEFFPSSNRVWEKIVEI